MKKGMPPPPSSRSTSRASSGFGQSPIPTGRRGTRVGSGRKSFIPEALQSFPPFTSLPVVLLSVFPVVLPLPCEMFTSFPTSTGRGPPTSRAASANVFKGSPVSADAASSEGGDDDEDNYPRRSSLAGPPTSRRGNARRQERGGGGAGGGGFTTLPSSVTAPLDDALRMMDEKDWTKRSQALHELMDVCLSHPEVLADRSQVLMISDELGKRLADGNGKVVLATAETLVQLLPMMKVGGAFSLLVFGFSPPMDLCCTFVDRPALTWLCRYW